MESEQLVVAPRRGLGIRAAELLTHPVTNVAMGMLVVLMHTSKLAQLFAEHRIGIQHSGILLNFFIISFYALAREVPRRVTLNPFYWALGAVSSFWGMVITLYSSGGDVIAPDWVIRTASVGSLIVISFARLSLGKSFGVVPAERKLVNRGAYRIVRHPIYTASVLTMVPVLLSSWGLQSVLLVVSGIALMVWRAFVEERFLMQSPEYRAYASEVRYRFIPGLL
ncbi:isoprenylcysteine carboxylmethyltransferase family protein [Pyxidicoccus parkwayensis]|uniref:Isoprenylcysteine carboxylmethyltransferase family protein n=1 Tax=Pyxidicoccus parkwayensis TaxID=2813578 RepID=A0ABX7P3V8_9BACT|nr:isoprenylcysteine carboxylmethyltransferase family protein [Pyxidicoccus parkwaysis]QSQ25154.1 isoprenylcysteine carboxylmethyltransferase family protein [Pyxidicoccus parkwaysis]